jgi:hypothetical protein
MIRSFFDSKGWMFMGTAELVAGPETPAGYENDVATIAVKLLERNVPLAGGESKSSEKT